MVSNRWSDRESASRATGGATNQAPPGTAARTEGAQPGRGVRAARGLLWPDLMRALAAEVPAATDLPEPSLAALCGPETGSAVGPQTARFSTRWIAARLTPYSFASVPSDTPWERRWRMVC